MVEIVVVSGKGGTGKTSVTGAFAHISQKHVLCDLDVDAPNLHLLLQPEPERIEDFYSGNEAIIDETRCQDCGVCEEMCRFDAVYRGDRGPRINPIKCEGCKVCVEFCPHGAIDFPEKHCGKWYRSNTRYGPLVHAQLFPGEENSGRLVALLRQQARDTARSEGLDLILCDGAPGIGCPVISSLSGTDFAVVVTEPTPSGFHDLVRVIDLCDHFKVPAKVIVNKWDLNPDESRKIEDYLAGRGKPVLARIDHDPAVTEAMVNGQAITEAGNGKTATALRKAWSDLLESIGRKKAA